jgi:hypothetical protein|tara:strand:+ start:960 stop:1193 length:234 start_codon:yes stop_codon:yes gene_type:complete
MIIQSETQTSVVKKLEEIANREEQKADKFLTMALKTAHEEGRTEILYCEKTEYEVLYEKSELLTEVLTEVRQQLEQR